MEEIGHEQRMCDSCEKKEVRLILQDRPICNHERECLKKNIIPVGINVMLFDFIRVQQDEGLIIPLIYLNISVVLCEECCPKDREKTLKIIVAKPRILQEAAISHRIYIDELIHDISEKEKEREVLSGRIKRLDDDICSAKELLVRRQKSMENIEKVYIKSGSNQSETRGHKVVNKTQTLEQAIEEILRNFKGSSLGLEILSSILVGRGFRSAHTSRGNANRVKICEVVTNLIKEGKAIVVRRGPAGPNETFEVEWVGK